MEKKMKEQPDEVTQSSLALALSDPLVQLGRLANCMVYGCIKTPGGQWPLTSAVDIMSGHASRLGWPWFHSGIDPSISARWPRGRALGEDVGLPRWRWSCGWRHCPAEVCLLSVGFLASRQGHGTRYTTHNILRLSLDTSRLFYLSFCFQLSHLLLFVSFLWSSYFFLSWWTLLNLGLVGCNVFIWPNKTECNILFVVIGVNISFRHSYKGCAHKEVEIVGTRVRMTPGCTLSALKNHIQSWCMCCTHLSLCMVVLHFENARGVLTWILVNNI